MSCSEELCPGKPVEFLVVGIGHTIFWHIDSSIWAKHFFNYRHMFSQCPQPHHCPIATIMPLN